MIAVNNKALLGVDWQSPLSEQPLSTVTRGAGRNLKVGRTKFRRKAPEKNYVRSHVVFPSVCLSVCVSVTLVDQDHIG